MKENEDEQFNNATAANILNNLIKDGIAVQDEEGNVTIPTASKAKKYWLALVLFLNFN